MSLSRWLIEQGGAADVVLTAMVLEFAWLVSRGRDARAVLVALLPGAALVLALRAAMMGAGWPVALLFVTLSLPLHLADLRSRGWLTADRALHRRARLQSLRKKS